MFSCAPFGIANPFAFLSLTPLATPTLPNFNNNNNRVINFIKRSSSISSLSYQSDKISQVHYDSLRVLEWDKLCDSVASFARTSLGRKATKVQLWSLSQTYEESLRLLNETNAAVEILKHGGCSIWISPSMLFWCKPP